jgi:TRAP-type C4-dicarboxylate transport system permease small subunit
MPPRAPSPARGGRRCGRKNENTQQEVPMRKLIDAYFTFLKVFIVACVALMVVLVFGNVVLRYALNSGITQAEEVSRWLFVWLTFTGAVLALRERAHLGVDMVVKRLPLPLKKACAAASLLLMILCAALFGQGSWQQMLLNVDVKAPATSLSMAWFYGVGVMFGVSAVGILLADLYLTLRGRSGHDLLLVRDSLEEDAQPVPGALQGGRP